MVLRYLQTVLKTELSAYVLFVLWTMVVESRKDLQIKEEIRGDGIGRCDRHTSVWRRNNDRIFPRQYQVVFKESDITNQDVSGNTCLFVMWNGILFLFIFTLSFWFISYTFPIVLTNSVVHEVTANVNIAWRSSRQVMSRCCWGPQIF
jgi:hypothetical protein